MAELVTPRQLTELTLPLTENEPDVVGSRALRAWMDKVTAFYNTSVTPTVQTLFVATADATVGNTVTETTLFGAGSGSLTQAANSLVVGRSLVVRMDGYITSGVPTFRVRVKLGATVIADTTAVATPNMAAAQAITVEAVLTCRSIGGAGTVFGQVSYNFSGTPVSATLSKFPSNTAAAVVVDTTAAQTLDVMATWGTAAVGNTLTITNSSVIVLN